MNQTLFISCLALFLGLPPYLLASRYLKKKPAWWVISVLIEIVGWASVLGTVICYFQYLGDCIAQYQSPPDELVERWANDGAKKAITIIFGWLCAILYSLPWLLIYVVASFIRKMEKTEPNVPADPAKARVR